MMFFSQHEIDALILEDVPLHDETVRALAMPNVLGEMNIRAREAGVMSGMGVLVKMAKTLDCLAQVSVEDGEFFEMGELVVCVRGKAHDLHKLWKQGVCLLEYMAGVASFTADLLARAQAVNPQVTLAATRKALPGSRKLLQQAVLHGGGMIHRAGLSETVLIFAQHRAFMLDGEDWASMISRMKQTSPEKKIMVEAETEADALTIAGGAHLTTKGQQLLATHERLQAMQSMWMASIADLDADVLPMMQRLRLTTSARNTFYARVLAIKSDAVEAQITLALQGEDKLIVTITQASVQRLRLVVGASVWALIKSTWVVLMEPQQAMRTSADNLLCGQVKDWVDDGVSSEVTLALAGGNTITAVITSASAKALAVTQGKDFCALIDASHIILGADVEH